MWSVRVICRSRRLFHLNSPVPSMNFPVVSCCVLSLSHLPLIFVHVSKCDSLTSIVCETLRLDLRQGTEMRVKSIVSFAFFLGTPQRTITTSSYHPNFFVKIYSVSLCVKVHFSNQLGFSGSREQSVLDDNRHSIRAHAGTEWCLVPIVSIKSILDFILRKSSEYEISEVKLICYVRLVVRWHESSMTRTGTIITPNTAGKMEVYRTSTEFISYLELIPTLLRMLRLYLRTYPYSIRIPHNILLQKIADQ